MKALGEAKGRLTAVLDDQTRRELVGWMFGQVVRACRASVRIGELIAVVGDADAAALADEHGVETLIEPRAGLGYALGTADAAMAGAGATIVIAADLPLATGDALDAVCAAAVSSPAVVVAPTRDGGTGALLRRPPDVVATAYGPGSAARHLRLAAEAGAVAISVEIPVLAFDVDTPAQLEEASRLDEQVRRWSVGSRDRSALPLPAAPPWPRARR